MVNGVFGYPLIGWFITVFIFAVSWCTDGIAIAFQPNSAAVSVLLRYQRYHFYLFQNSLINFPENTEGTVTFSNPSLFFYPSLSFPKENLLYLYETFSLKERAILQFPSLDENLL